MPIIGKIIGGLCGLLLAGPFGLFLGLVIGHFFDRGLHTQWKGWYFTAKQHVAAQKVFFKATFLVMGHIAKADGHVSEAEIQAVRLAMDRMGLNESSKQEAVALFTQGKQPNFRLDQTLQELLRACHQNKPLLQLFLELQLRVAQADGFNPAKQKVFQQVCQQLGIPSVSFSFFEDLFGFGAGAAGYRSGAGASYQRTYGPPPRRPERTLGEAYSILNISENATEAEVKRAYRRLMSQNHPDKLIAKGLPDQMIKLATEKTQTIKAAYEQICEVRDIK